MLIDIHPPSPKHLTQIDTLFALQQDGWNDYSFQTLYHLYYRKSGIEPDVVYVGPVKILRRGQTKHDPILIRDPFESLGEDFVSVGNSLEYYQRLNEIPNSDRNAILDALHDAVVHPELVANFRMSPDGRSPSLEVTVNGGLTWWTPRF